MCTPRVAYMDTVSELNVFIGAETGLLKGVNVQKRSWCNLNNLECASKENKITSMCWGNVEQTKVCLALRNRTVVEYDVLHDDLAVFEEMQAAEGYFRGLVKCNQTFVTCTNEGVLQAWADKPVVIDTGGDVKKMRESPTDKHVIATGGDENDLKLWDLNRPEEAIFKAKNVRNDRLNLRVPVCVMDMGFFQDNTIAVGTGHHHVRVYDPNHSQRRPVLEMEYDEYPITALSVRPNTKQVVVGNTKGSMATLDLRMKGAVVNAFKDVDGSIRSIQCHATKDLVASCGLDRFLRIHDLNTKKLVNKFYLKSRLNCLLFADLWQEENDDPQQTTKSKQTKQKQEDESDSDMDVWDELDEVEEESRKTKTTNVTKELDENLEESDYETAEKMKKRKKSKKSAEENIESDKMDQSPKKLKRSKSKKSKKKSMES